MSKESSPEPLREKILVPKEDKLILKACANCGHEIITNKAGNLVHITMFSKHFSVGGMGMYQCDCITPKEI